MGTGTQVGGENEVYTVVMVGSDGRLYRTECRTAEEAKRLEEHHKNLGWEAWTEGRTK